MFDVGPLFELDITALTVEGDGLGFRDGREVRVFGALPGETVTAQTISDRRKYLFAQAVEVSGLSSQRVRPKCPHFGACTGCQWQHVDYEHQLGLKQRQVQQALQKFGLDPGITQPVLPADVPWNYRNHARFTLRRDGSAGFVHRETRRFVRIDACLIMHPWINDTLEKLQGRCRGMTQVSVRYGVNTGRWLIQPGLNIEGVELASGQPYYEEVFRGRTFRISSPSFFQVNLEQADKLVSTVLHYLNPDGTETIVDAYAGVGTFAVALAPYVGRAVAIEESASAIKDARENVSGLPKVQLVQGKVEHELAAFPSRVDAVILDPPRSGCHPDVLAALGRHAPNKLLYVSCDPETLARDMAALYRNGFEPVEVQPLDMFPQTHRVECAAFLVSRGQKGKPRTRIPILLASTSPRRIGLLSCLGLPFRTASPEVDESAVACNARTARERAELSALAKANWAAERHPGEVVVAGDTIVADNGEVLGKPSDAAEAVAMLRRLRGTTHRVITGIAVLKPGDAAIVCHVVSGVKMRHYSDAEIENYVASGDPLDKAGAYGVQNEAFHPAEAVDGCYLNVVGLPLCKLVRMLRDMRVEVQPALPAICDPCPLREPSS